MEVAFGWKAHAGWAALVVVGRGERGFLVVDRRRVALVDEAWARQPCHAAEALDPEAAGAMVARGIDVAHRGADRAMRAAVARASARASGRGGRTSGRPPSPPWLRCRGGAA
jgi:hypothetical protein